MEFKVTQLQRLILEFVGHWVKIEKTPVPQREIVLAMKEHEAKEFTTVNAINSLIKKGYIRKSYTISNKRSYVQLKSI